MRTTIAIIASIVCYSAISVLIGPDDWVNPITMASRPLIEEQQAAAVTLIADALFSPDLAAVAVGQSRKDTCPRINASRAVQYNIEDVIDLLNIRPIVRALNMTPVFSVETVYAAFDLPPILAMLQDEMYGQKLGGSYAPLNFRPALFPFDNTVWLAFLKSDSVFNYNMDSFGSTVDDRATLDNVLTNQTTVAGFKQGLMLEGVLSETNQFSLVKPYANFPIQKPGLPFTPFTLEGKTYTSDENLGRELWAGQPLDLTKELVLPGEFLADLRAIIQYAAAYTPELAQPAMVTPIGAEVLARVRAKLGEGASNAHLRADWIRPPPGP